MSSQAIRFGPHIVTSQVFHATRLSFCCVNLKPLLPGHVLVCPLRSVQHISDLEPAEVTDLFMTVQQVTKTLKRVYKTSSVNIGIADGVLAGQTVPHVHAHVIPRQRKGDYGDDDDKLYADLEGNDRDHAHALKQRQGGQHIMSRVQSFGDTSGPRPPRTAQQMEEEAEWLRKEMDQDGQQHAV